MGSAATQELRVDGAVRIASLRYHRPDGAFAATLPALNLALPQTLCCVSAGPAVPGTLDVLAWRSPTEAVWISGSSERFEHVQRELLGVSDGCIVERTHGRRLLRLRAAQAGLLAHLGRGFAELPTGEARIGRLADIAVLACKPSAEEILLVIDRLHLEHFLGCLDTVVPLEPVAASAAPLRTE
jgi:hypothetical protein